MVEEYYTVAKPACIESVVRKSRFICNVRPVETTTEAQAFLDTRRKEHRDATHNVWAWRLGQQGQEERCSDDGEPQGTAGIPVLEVLRKKGLTNCIVVVTRYFGGTLLGAGGLVRAYTESAVAGVTAAGISRFCRYRFLSMTVQYPLLGSVLRLLEEAGTRLEDSDFGEEVTVKGWVLPSSSLTLEKQIAELGRGTLELNWGGEQFHISGGESEVQG